MRPSKKVAIKVYVPAGRWCQGYSFKCPMLQDGHVGFYCALIPEGIWFNTHGWIKKHNKCPSLLAKGNKLTDKDILNLKLRTFQKAARDNRLDNYLSHLDNDKREGEV